MFLDRNAESDLISLDLVKRIGSRYNMQVGLSARKFASDPNRVWKVGPAKSEGFAKHREVYRSSPEVNEFQRRRRASELGEWGPLRHVCLEANTMADMCVLRSTLIWQSCVS